MNSSRNRSSGTGSIEMAVWQGVKRYLTADEKATVSSIIGLAGAATEAAVWLM
ncbi:hypothetical protein [Snodgrassella alvi]|uniref:hypothetical protein n=1 Tax=Snodgrassella alvi TaxID=1196083 RepID=UPI001552DEDF|nr:hypothetical protein [Snodgrassella alvi]